MCLLLFALHSTRIELPLHLSHSITHILCTQALIYSGADPNAPAQDRIGRTPLFMAAGRGAVAAVEELLVARAAVDLPCSDGRTPLFAAAEQGHGDVVARLLSDGASVDTELGSGATALHVAASEGHDEVVQLLLEAGAGLEGKVGEVLGVGPWKWVFVGGSGRCGHAERRSKVTFGVQGTYGADLIAVMVREGAPCGVLTWSTMSPPFWSMP